MEKDLQQEKEKTEVLEVKNDTPETTMRNETIDQKNNKNKINELKGVSNKKDVQEEKHNMAIASVEAFAIMLLNDETKQDKERRECQGKFRKLEVNDNQLLIEINKKRQKVVTLQNDAKKVKQTMSNNKFMVCKHFESKGCEKIV